MDPSAFAGKRIPCQCRAVASLSSLRTVMRTRSPRLARSVGPRKAPLTPHVVDGPCETREDRPAWATSSKLTPSASRWASANGGMCRGAVNSIFPAVSSGARDENTEHPVRTVPPVAAIPVAVSAKKVRRLSSEDCLPITRLSPLPDRSLRRAVDAGIPCLLQPVRRRQR